MNNGFGFNNGNRFEIREKNRIGVVKKLILTESDKYRKQFIRPLTTNITNKDLEEFKNIVREKELRGAGRQFVENEFTNKLSHTAQLAAMPISESPIINGWDTKRFKFALEVEWREPGTNRTYIDFIQGYTDEFGYSELRVGQGKLNERMKFFPNSILRISKNIDKQGNPIVRVIGNYKLILDETKSLKNFKVADISTLFTEISAMRTLQDGIKTVTDTSNLTSPNIIPKEINIPVKLISQLIDNIVTTAELSSDFDASDDVYRDMINNALSNYLDNIDFLKWLVNLKGNDFYWFTLEELKLLDPFIDKKVKPIIKAPAQQVAHIVPDTQDSAEVYDSSLETRMAVTLQEAISDLMSECFLESIAFTASNLSGKMEWAIQNATPVVEGLNPVPFINKFMNMFYKYTWLPLTQHEQIALNIKVVAYMEADTIITIEIDNSGHEIVYKFPTFANSRFSPVIMDQNTMALNASNIGEIVDVGVWEVEQVKREATKLFNNATYSDFDFGYNFQ